MSDDTTFIQRSADTIKKRPIATAATGGLGLSAAAVVWMYTQFATNSDLEKLRASQSNQWQAYQRQTDTVSALRLELSDVKGQNRAYELVVLMLRENQKTKVEP